MQTPAQIRASKLADIKTRLGDIKTRAAVTKDRLEAAKTAAANTPANVTVSFTASDGTQFMDQESRDRYEQNLSNRERSGQSAFALLREEFQRYGLGDLVGPLEKFIKQGLSRDELVIELRNDPVYKTRFAGNQARIDKGLRALSEAEYIRLEDEYQNVMQRYGLPETYYKREGTGKQPGFEQLIEFDVSPAELEERVMVAQNRVKNAPPEVLDSLRAFYPSITNGEILAYTLNPKQAIEDIKRKVTAAEIGAGAVQAGLLGRRPEDIAAYTGRAEELAAFGVTGEQARAGFQTVASALPRAQQLSQFYQEEPITQRDIESEVFGTTGSVEARKRRERIIGREQAAFSGTSGAAQGALARERAGQL
jgi:hypothetical protein